MAMAVTGITVALQQVIDLGLRGNIAESKLLRWIVQKIRRTSACHPLFESRKNGGGHSHEFLATTPSPRARLAIYWPRGGLSQN